MGPRKNRFAIFYTFANHPVWTLKLKLKKGFTNRKIQSFYRITSGGDMESITLTKGKASQKPISKKHVTVREKGILVIAEAPDLGLVVHWDKGTVFPLPSPASPNDCFRNTSLCESGPAMEGQSEGPVWKLQQ